MSRVQRMHAPRALICAWALPVLTLPVYTSASADRGFMVSADGKSVLDAKSQLIWRRCVEGMQWNGRTCRGLPQLLDYGQATKHAAMMAKKDGMPWRLPRSTELSRLIDKQPQPPMVDPVSFPATPSEWHWTNSITVNNPGFNPYNYGNISKGATPGSVNAISLEHAWAVNFATGEASGTILRRSPLAVRLVRSAP